LTFQRDADNIDKALEALDTPGNSNNNAVHVKKPRHQAPPKEAPRPAAPSDKPVADPEAAVLAEVEQRLALRLQDPSAPRPPFDFAAGRKYRMRIHFMDTFMPELKAIREAALEKPLSKTDIGLLGNGEARNSDCQCEFTVDDFAKVHQPGDPAKVFDIANFRILCDNKALSTTEQLRQFAVDSFHTTLKKHGITPETSDLANPETETLESDSPVFSPVFNNIKGACALDGIRAKNFLRIINVRDGQNNDHSLLQIIQASKKYKADVDAMRHEIEATVRRELLEEEQRKADERAKAVAAKEAARAAKAAAKAAAEAQASKAVVVVEAVKPVANAAAAVDLTEGHALVPTGGLLHLATVELERLRAELARANGVGNERAQVIRDLEGQLQVKDARIAELEAELLALRSAPPAPISPAPAPAASELPPPSVAPASAPANEAPPAPESASPAASPASAQDEQMKDADATQFMEVDDDSGKPAGEPSAADPYDLETVVRGLVEGPVPDDYMPNDQYREHNQDVYAAYDADLRTMSEKEKQRARVFCGELVPKSAEELVTIFEECQSTPEELIITGVFNAESGDDDELLRMWERTVPHKLVKIYADKLHTLDNVQSLKLERVFACDLPVLKKLFEAAFGPRDM
jgi:hypothetical protein